MIEQKYLIKIEALRLIDVDHIVEVLREADIPFIDLIEGEKISTQREPCVNCQSQHRHGVSIDDVAWGCNNLRHRLKCAAYCNYYNEELDTSGSYK